MKPSLAVLEREIENALPLTAQLMTALIFSILLVFTLIADLVMYFRIYSNTDLASP
jgi:hypothetical protein